MLFEFIIERCIIFPREIRGLYMNFYLNIAMIVGFGALAITMFVKFFRVRGKIIIQDKTWNGIRMGFGVIEVLAVLSIFMQGNTTIDYFRIVMMVLACTAYMIARDGLGEEGLIHNGHLIPWNKVRAWDKSETGKSIELFFTLEPEDPKKPDKYSTIEIDFDKANKEQIDRFLNLNLKRKYTRMKRK